MRTLLVLALLAYIAMATLFVSASSDVSLSDMDLDSDDMLLMELEDRALASAEAEDAAYAATEAEADAEIGADTLTEAEGEGEHEGATDAEVAAEFSQQRFKLKSLAKKIGRAVNKGVKKVSHAVQKGAKKLGRAIKKGVVKVKKWLFGNKKHRHHHKKRLGGKKHGKKGKKGKKGRKHRRHGKKKKPAIVGLPMLGKSLKDVKYGTALADLKRYTKKRIIRVIPTGIGKQLPGDRDNNEDAIKAVKFDLRHAKSIKEKHLKEGNKLVPKTDKTNEKFRDWQAKSNRLPLIAPHLFND